jgi:hypothetical protein
MGTHHRRADGADAGQHHGVGGQHASDWRARRRQSLANQSQGGGPDLEPEPDATTPPGGHVSPTPPPGEASGIDPDVTFHWLRHTHGSRLVAAGWDVAAVAARLGDAVATVQDTYVHEFDAVRREARQREQLAAMAASTADGRTMAARTETKRATAGL